MRPKTPTVWAPATSPGTFVSIRRTERVSQSQCLNITPTFLLPILAKINDRSNLCLRDFYFPSPAFGCRQIAAQL